MAGKCQDILHADLEHSEVESCKSEKSFGILRSPGIWQFFQIFSTPLLNTPNWLAMRINLFHPGTHKQILTASGQTSPSPPLHCLSMAHKRPRLGEGGLRREYRCSMVQPWQNTAHRPRGRYVVLTARGIEVNSESSHLKNSFHPLAYIFISISSLFSVVSQ
jgi:hypothetical protein